MKEEPSTPLSWEEMRFGVNLLLSGGSPERLEAVLDPFQAVGVFITPVGWFSRLLWRFIRFKMDWKQKPFRVYREVPNHGS